MSQILPHFFVSNPRTRQEYYKLVKAEILKLAPNICYFIQLLRLDIAIVKSYYRLSSDLYRKYVLSLLWHLHGSSSSWPTSGRSMPEVVLLDFGNCPLFIYRRPTLIWTNLSKSNLLVISAVQCNSTQIYCIPGTFFIHLKFFFKRKDRICKEKFAKDTTDPRVECFYQRNKGYITSSYTNLDQISSSESRPRFNFITSTKHQRQNTN